MSTKNTGTERMGRRTMPKVRKHGVKNKALTLGDLIAAAMEVSGGDVKEASNILSSREMARALGRRIQVA